MASSKQKIKIEGLSDLEDALKELPRATIKSTLKRVLIKAAGPMRDAAEAHAPVRSGMLKASPTIGTKLTKEQAKQHRADVGTTPKMTIGGWRSEPSTAVYVFMGPTPHAKSVQQEFGNERHAPHPFMRPAFDNNAGTGLTTITQDLTDEIEKARKRIARRAERLAAKTKAGN